ncbi:MAG: hypothetical protein HY898_28675 [Deltaproteobacteria bacterium]|nr:hypothetical protein [Deltaproteobacteria bacterium]
MKRDLPASEVAGIYESSQSYAVTTVRLSADHSFVMESSTCKAHDVIRGRWEQTGDGYLALRRNPHSESDSGTTAEESGLADICKLDPQACPEVRVENIRMRVVGDVLELHLSSAQSNVQKLQRRAKP